MERIHTAPKWKESTILHSDDDDDDDDGTGAASRLTSAVVFSGVDVEQMSDHYHLCNPVSLSHQVHRPPLPRRHHAPRRLLPTEPIVVVPNPLWSVVIVRLNVRHPHDADATRRVPPFVVDGASGLGWCEHLMVESTVEEKQTPWLCRYVDKRVLAAHPDLTAPPPAESDQTRQTPRIMSIPVSHRCMECIKLLTDQRQRLTVDGERWYIPTLP